MGDHQRAVPGLRGLHLRGTVPGLFMVLKEDGRLHQADPEEPLELFGAGEAHAIALARELAQLSQQTAATEAALMKQWIREGMRAKKIELAIQAYMQRRLDLRGAAAISGVSYNRFLREVQARNIVVLEDDGFLERLAFLAATFDDVDLRSAIKLVTSVKAE